MKKNKKGILFIILLTICLICPLNTTVKAEQIQLPKRTRN